MRQIVLQVDPSDGTCQRLLRFVTMSHVGDLRIERTEDGQLVDVYPCLTSWLQVTLARRYDAVLDERLPPELESLIMGCLDQPWSGQR